MGKQDRIVATIIFSVLAVLWLGFLVHRSPFFAGSLLGGVFGVVGAACMLVPLVYTVVKRSAKLRRAFTKKHSFGSLLQAHVYFGLIGALLAIIHSGHKFQSVLGVALTASMLLSVLTGFIGQYYLRYVAENIRERKAQLDGLWRSLDGQYWTYAQGLAADGAGTVKAAAELLPLVSAAADLQYSVQFQGRVRKLFNAWLSAHIAFSIIFYLLLALHIWAGIYFGLRWFR
ncbi:MAG: hypothetical protein KDI08_01530 [Pseudomonadales bacterium]|jgi:hypothetical protein|nr:hypothetical protein [Pseudomonadales bacterium]MCP5333413.1 hypothetical protein [Pseudomonadales bacterium]